MVKKQKPSDKKEKNVSSAKNEKKVVKKAEKSQKTAKKAPDSSKIAKKSTEVKKSAQPVKKAPVAAKKVAQPVKKAQVAAKKVAQPAKKAQVAAKKAPVAAKKQAPVAVQSSKTAMDSFKKTLNEVHKRGMTKLSVNDRKMLRRELQNLHDRVLGEIEFLTDDSLNRSMKDTAGDMTMHGMHMADHGTDNFDREFALNLVSAEHDVLYEINDALRRIDSGTYGVCEDCGCQVEKARLEALPFARFCINCKSAKEKGSIKYRPLGPTLSTHF